MQEHRQTETLSLEDVVLALTQPSPEVSPTAGCPLVERIDLLASQLSLSKGFYSLQPEESSFTSRVIGSSRKIM